MGMALIIVTDRLLANVWVLRELGEEAAVTGGGRVLATVSTEGSVVRQSCDRNACMSISSFFHFGRDALC